MDDKIIFAAFLIVAVIGVFIGLSTSVGVGVVSFGENGNGLFASAFAAVSTDLSSTVGQFLISFDDFENIHQVVLDQAVPVKVFDIASHLPTNRMYAGTDRGLFMSRDGGLTWNRLKTYANEISQDALVFRLVPLSSNGNEYLLSVFQNNVGTVYITRDAFFTLEKIVDFDDEAPYDMRLIENRLYLAMSNGQLTLYDIARDHARVVNTFKEPIVRIDTPSDGYVYLLLKNGSLLKGQSLLSDFRAVKVPGGSFFRSALVKNLEWDNVGTLYVHTQNGMLRSSDSGATFETIKSIPMVEDRIDAIAVHENVIYVISEQRMFTSFDGAKNWKIKDIYNQFPVAHLYFIGERAVLSL